VVVNELRGEKIDVIRWSPDPATYVANALSPARVDEVILVNPEGRQAHVLVSDNQLSLAIGKEGQNVRLAARLTGWKIDIKDVSKYDHEGEQEKISAVIAQERERIAALEAAYPIDEDDDDEYEDEEYSQPENAAELEVVAEVDSPEDFAVAEEDEEFEDEEFEEDDEIEEED